MVNTFSEYLPHFAVKALHGLDFGGRIKPLGAADVGPPADGPAEAEARGRREALAEARSEFEEVRARDLAAYEARLAEKEREFATSTADVLADRLTTALKATEEALAGKVATALSRFLESAVRNRAVDELTETVAALLAAGGATRIRVNGPAPLIARLRERLSSRGDAIVYITDGSPDLTVAIDDTIVETRIAAWADRLRAATTGDGE